MSIYKVKNNETFEKLLDFYNFFDKKIKPYGLGIYLYGSLSYLHYTKDENIVVGDIDLLTTEENYREILDIFKDNSEITSELSQYNSVRLFRNGLKLSIHSLESSKEVTDVTKNISEITINGTKFKSVSILDQIKFYKTSVSLKDGYKEKLNNLLKVYFGNNHTFFLLKPSVLESDRIQEIEKYIENNRFEIIEKKEDILDECDIEYLYKEEYENFLGKEDSKKALDINKKMFKNKKVVFLLTKGENAIKRAGDFKGDTYWPMNCKKDTIRYVFRNRDFDSFNLIKGKIIDVPCDNVVHCPKTFYEFKKIVLKWFL